MDTKSKIEALTGRKVKTVTNGFCYRINKMMRHEIAAFRAALRPEFGIVCIHEYESHIIFNI